MLALLPPLASAAAPTASPFASTPARFRAAQPADERSVAESAAPAKVLLRQLRLQVRQVGLLLRPSCR